MPHIPYRGETASKAVARQLVWWQHQRLLGRSFHRTPHLFLASRVAGDVQTLREMGVKPDNIWAIDSDPRQVEALIPRMTQEGIRVFNQRVELVCEGNEARTCKAKYFYLDYCGNIQGTRRSRQRVVTQLPCNSVLSVTLFLGREPEGAPLDREAALLAEIRSQTSHNVTLTQSISYKSASGSKGSVMQTWTFWVGLPTSRSKMRFDLTGTHLEVSALWAKTLQTAERRTQAAILANVTRRL